MEIQPHPQEVYGGFVRRRCRNPRCSAKLKRETNNPRNAFCCRDCFERHYRKLCLVCERPLRRKAERKGGRPAQFCSPKCKSKFRWHPERFLGVWANGSGAHKTHPLPALQATARNTLRSAHFTGLKIRAKDRPTWRVIAGPAANFHPINLAVPLDPQTTARVRRANELAAIDTTPIPTPGWPVILMGGSDLERRRAGGAHLIMLTSPALGDPWREVISPDGVACQVRQLRGTRARGRTAVHANA